MAGVRGVVDLNIEAQAEIPMLRIHFDQDALARYGMSTGQAADAVEMAFSGKRVSQVLEGQIAFDMVLRYDDEARQDLDAVRNTLISTPLGPKVPLQALADLQDDRGPELRGARSRAAAHRGVLQRRGEIAGGCRERYPATGRAIGAVPARLPVSSTEASSRARLPPRASWLPWEWWYSSRSSGC